MADLSITAANVTGTSYTAYLCTSGATITAGMAVYIDTGQGNVGEIAHCETSAATATVKGIAMNTASDGQPLQLATAGNIDLGATLTVGAIYVLSASGKIAPVGDLATNDYVSIIGIATAADDIKLSINNSGVQKP